MVGLSFIISIFFCEKMNNIKLSVIIVTYNNEGSILNCVTSVLKNIPEDSEVIIIDNASTDFTREKLEKILSKNKNLIVLDSKKNLGFGKANNKASELAKGEFLFLLNPDTVIPKPIFGEIINFYEDSSNVGIVGVKLIQSDGSVQESVKKQPTFFGAFQEFVMGKKNAYSQFAPNTKEPLEVDVLYGAAMLLKKDLFEKAGGFDEKYFLYYEDVDFCRKVRKLNKKVIYYPKVWIEHLVGGSKTNSNRIKLNQDSARIYHGVFEYFFIQVLFFIPRLKRRLGLK